MHHSNNECASVVDVQKRFAECDIFLYYMVYSNTSHRLAKHSHVIDT